MTYYCDWYFITDYTIKIQNYNLKFDDTNYKNNITVQFKLKVFCYSKFKF